jgi:transposase-like protein
VRGRDGETDEAPLDVSILTSIAPRTIIHKHFLLSRSRASFRVFEGDQTSLGQWFRSMQKSSCRDDVQLWLTRPLVRSYRCVVFHSSLVSVLMDDCHWGGRVRWALGFLQDGACDALGAWVHADANAGVLNGPVAQLGARGIERIDVIVRSDWDGGWEKFRRAFLCRAAVLSVEDSLAGINPSHVRRRREEVMEILRASLLAANRHSVQDTLHSIRGLRQGRQSREHTLDAWESLLSLSEATRSLVLLSDRTASALQGRLAEAVKKHGCFESSDAALDFIADALRRAERRMDRDRIVANAEPRICRAMADGGLAPACTT